MKKQLLVLALSLAMVSTYSFMSIGSVFADSDASGNGAQVTGTDSAVTENTAQTVAPAAEGTSGTDGTGDTSADTTSGTGEQAQTAAAEAPAQEPAAVEKTTADLDTIYVAADGTDANIGETAEAPTSLSNALEKYKTGATIIMAGGEYTLAGGTYDSGAAACYLNRSVSIQKASGSESAAVVTLTGGSYGIVINGSGSYSFSGLTINSATNLSNISVENYMKDITNTTSTDYTLDASQKAVVNVSNCVVTNTWKSAIDFEGNGAISSNYANYDRNYFDLTVSNCDITADPGTDKGHWGYGIGSGLSNNYCDLSHSSLTVTGCTFNKGQVTYNATYGIRICSNSTAYANYNMGSVNISGNSFYNVNNGIWYAISSINKENIIIDNNDFTPMVQTNADTGNGNALGVYNYLTDTSDPYSYSFAKEMKGNNLSGEKILTLFKANIDVIWFPDGQAVNATNFNNFSDTNTTDAGTRYLKYGVYSKALVLTDFGIDQDLLTFATAASASQTFTFTYNTKTVSGAYSNYTNMEMGAADSYFTESNTKHASSDYLANYTKSYAITSWKEVNAAGEDYDSGLITFETTSAGTVTVTPTGAGTGVAYIKATVGTGPNAKSDIIKINIGSTPIITPIVDPTPTPTPTPDPGTVTDDPTNNNTDNPGTTTDDPENNNTGSNTGNNQGTVTDTVTENESQPQTGDQQNIFAWIAVLLSGMGFTFLLKRRDDKGTDN